MTLLYCSSYSTVAWLHNSADEIQLVVMAVLRYHATVESLLVE